MLNYDTRSTTHQINQYVVLCLIFHFCKSCLFYFVFSKGSDIIQNETCFSYHELFTRLSSYAYWTVHHLVI